MAYLTGIALDGTAATLTKSTLQANKVYFYVFDVNDVNASVIKVTLRAVKLDIAAFTLNVEAVDNSGNVYILPADTTALYATDTAAETAIVNAFTSKISVKVANVNEEIAPEV